MLKKIAVVMLSVAMCVPFGSVVMAEEDNSARIAEIEAQIAELEAELRELKGGQEQRRDLSCMKMMRLL